MADRLGRVAHEPCTQRCAPPGSRPPQRQRRTRGSTEQAAVVEGLATRGEGAVSISDMTLSSWRRRYRVVGAGESSGRSPDKPALATRRASGSLRQRTRIARKAGRGVGKGPALLLRRREAATTTPDQTAPFRSTQQPGRECRIPTKPETSYGPGELARPGFVEPA